MAIVDGRKECKSPSRILLENDMKSNIFNVDIKKSNKANPTN